VRRARAPKSAGAQSRQPTRSARRASRTTRRGGRSPGCRSQRRGDGPNILSCFQMPDLTRGPPSFQRKGTFSDTVATLLKPSVHARARSAVARSPALERHRQQRRSVPAAAALPGDTGLSAVGSDPDHVPNARFQLTRSCVGAGISRSARAALVRARTAGTSPPSPPPSTSPRQRRNPVLANARCWISVSETTALTAERSTPLERRRGVARSWR
jgi:hypothetical protein